jgi:hypothetical protein
MRSPLVIATLVPAALLVAACGGGGSAAPAPTPPAVSAVAPTTTEIPGLSPARSEWALAQGAGAKAVSNVGSDGQGRTVTRILVAGARDDSTRQVRYVDGAWALPVPVPGGDTEGLSYDGGVAVLQSTDTPSRFVVLHVATHAKPVVVDLQRDGSFGYDALSPSGNDLYLTQYRDVTGLRVDKIRRYDLRAGQLDPTPVVDKSEGGEAMAGTPVARTRSSDGATVYTIYEGAEHPFLHMLLTQSAISFCIDLPGRAAGGATGTWTVKLGATGATLTATSDRLEKSFLVSLRDVPALERVAALPAGAPAS